VSRLGIFFYGRHIAFSPRSAGCACEFFLPGRTAMITSTHNALSAYAAQSTGKLSVSSQYLDIMGGTQGSKYDKQDSASISSTAREMYDRVKNLDVFSLIYPNNDATKKTKSLGDVKNDFMADFNDFSAYFGKMSMRKHSNCFPIYP
jgi:hypothetical protein